MFAVVGRAKGYKLATTVRGYHLSTYNPIPKMDCNITVFLNCNRENCRSKRRNIDVKFPCLEAQLTMQRGNDLAPRVPLIHMPYLIEMTAKDSAKGP